MLHINSTLDTPGMLVALNPSSRPITTTLHPDLDCTALTERTRSRDADSDEQRPGLSRDYTMDVEVTNPARGMTWIKSRQPRCCQERTPTQGLRKATG
jgi:hypothetical protein